jgi:thioredoxin 2
MTDSMFITCASCGAKNRVPSNRVSQDPVCGKCKTGVLTPAPINLDDQGFQRFIQNNDMPIVVDFWASWCGPCQMMAPIFNQVSQEMFQSVRFVKVDTEQAQQTSAQYGIRSIPSLLVFKNGREIARQAGALDKSSLTQWLNSVK